MTPIERMAAAAPPLDSEIQKHLTNFSLITHGFGGPAMVAVLNAFRHYLNSMKANYEKILNGMDSGHSSSSNTVNASQKNPLNSYSMNRNAASYFNANSSSSSSSNSSSSSSSSNSRIQQQNPSLIELASLKVESKD